jgi:hypothetical protein
VNPLRHARWGPWVAMFLFVLGFAFIVLAGIYTVHQQERVNEQLCLSTVANRQADRVQWITLRDLTLPTLESDNEKIAFARLVEGVLDPIPELVCHNNKPVVK